MYGFALLSSLDLDLDNGVSTLVSIVLFRILGELERDLDLVLKRLFELYGFELLSSLDLDLERLFAPPFTFDLERTFPSFLLLDTEGDTECDADLIFCGDLECL